MKLILNYLSFIGESLSEDKIEQYIKNIKKEIEENSSDETFIYEYSNPNNNEWIINFTYEDIPYRYELDVLNSRIIKFMDGSIDFEKDYDNLETCFQLIKKDIFNLFKTNEAKVSRKTPSKYS